MRSSTYYDGLRFPSGRPLLHDCLEVGSRDRPFSWIISPQHVRGLLRRFTPPLEGARYTRVRVFHKRIEVPEGDRRPFRPIRHLPSMPRTRRIARRIFISRYVDVTGALAEHHLETETLRRPRGDLLLAAVSFEGFKGDNETRLLLRGEATHTRGITKSEFSACRGNHVLITRDCLTYPCLSRCVHFAQRVDSEGRLT
jgi:hypothetical protein